jgi:hypothetical protein
VCATDCLDKGTILPYLELANAHDFEVFVMNPNQSYTLKPIADEQRVKEKRYVERENAVGESEYFEQIYVAHNENEYK